MDINEQEQTLLSIIRNAEDPRRAAEIAAALLEFLAQQTDTEG